MVVDIIGFDKVGSSMKVFHVISSISRQGGGPSRSSQGLVAGLCAAGVEAWLMTLRHGESPWIKGVDKFVNGGSFEEALTRIKPDIVHLHGIWQYELHRCAAICRRKCIPYLIAPRGMLETWSLRAKWLKKRLARLLYQDRDLKKAVALHATAESEAAQFRRLGFKNPVIISPNGVNLPAEAEGTGRSRRRFAEDKVSKWLDGVSEESFCAALERLVDEKMAAGEYRFKKLDDRVAATEGARRFFVEFSRKIVEMSDGRCVYFVPDPRAKERNGGNADRCWAEYSFHAVSNGGAKVSGKGYNERWFNPHKIAGFDALEMTLKAERCVVRLSPTSRFDAIMFVGGLPAGLRYRIVTRLDEFGNMDANLTEVTFEASSKAEKKTPRLVSLTEAVQAVVHHQIATGSYPSDESRISNFTCLRKGGAEAEKAGDGSARRALFVSRMHPKKGVLELVESWSRVLGRVNPKNREAWCCELVYTLNGEEERTYEAEVKERILSLGLSYQDREGNVHLADGTPASRADFILTGPLNDDAKWAAYARANLFVLPTYSENFGIVVAEALWAGVPVITTKGTPWQELEVCRCGWWIDLPPKASLDAALREAMALPRETLREMGARGRSLVEGKYTWKAVCDAMVEGYQRIMAGNRSAV